MSYSIDVTVPEVPKNLRRKWEQEFAKHGIKVEVDPKFDLTTWNDPVVFKVMEMPRRYAGLDITEPVEGGFGLTRSAVSRMFQVMRHWRAPRHRSYICVSQQIRVRTWK